MASIESLVAQLAARATPEIIENIDAAFELRFAGEEERWYLDLKPDAAEVLSNTQPEGDVCRLGLHAEDLEDLLEGQTTMKGLVATGRFRVFGDMGAAMKLEALFA